MSARIGSIKMPDLDARLQHARDVSGDVRCALEALAESHQRACNSLGELIAAAAKGVEVDLDHASTITLALEREGEAAAGKAAGALRAMLVTLEDAAPEGDTLESA